RALPAPGQVSNVPFAFNVTRGFLENGVETAVSAAAAPDGKALSTAVILQAAQEQGIPLTLLGRDDLALLSSFGLSADATARIGQALQAGRLVLAPTAPVTIGGRPMTAWYEIDPNTGALTGVMENGAHQAVSEYAAAVFDGFLLAFFYVTFQAGL